MKIKVLHLCLSLTLLASVGVGEFVYASETTLSRQEIAEARRALTQATILQKSGKPAEANAFLKEKFPNGPPAGDLAVGYYKIIASLPGGWNEARSGLESLVKSDPKNLQYSLALDTLLGSKRETRDLAIHNLAETYQVRKVDKQRVLQVWREVLNAQEIGPDLIPLYEQYLKLDPHNQEITGRWILEKDALEERKRIANDPLLRRRQVGLDLLDKGDIVGAEAPLMDTLKARPKDYLALGGMGLIRMRQGNYEEAAAYYQKALALNPENSGKWKSLISTSQYWGQIHQAEDARDKKNYSLAMEKIRAAINLEPQGAEAIAVLGTIEADRGNSKEAEKQFREALAIESDNGIALRGLVQLLINAGKRDEALALINAQAPENSPAGKGYDYLRIKILSSQADELVSKGQGEAAIPYLQRALKLDPPNPWLRFQLAGVYEGLGSVDKGLAVMKEGLRLAPNDPEMTNANVLFLLSADKAEEALSLMRSALSKPSADVNSLRLTYANVLNRLQRDDELNPVLQQLAKAQLSAGDKLKFTQIRLDFDIRQALKAGDTQKAIVLLKQAIALDKDEIWLRLDLARLYAKLHRPKEGIAIFDAFLKTHPNSVEGLYAYALFLSGLEQNQPALKVLERIPAADRTPKIIRFQRGVWVDLQLTQVNRLNAQGDKAKAIAQLSALEIEVSNDPDLSSLVALMWGKIVKVEQANALFSKIEQSTPNLSVEWHLRYANYLLNNDQPEAFQREMALVAAQKLSPGQKQDYDDLQEAAELRAIGQYIQSGDIQLAKQKLQPLISVTPNNYKMMYLDSQIQRREGYLDKAIDIEQRALAQSPVPLSSYHSLSTLKPVASPSGVSVFQIEPPILEPSAVASGSAYQYKQMADMIDMRTNWLDTAVDYLSLNGTQGQSYYRATEIPLEWKMPLRSDERVTFRADQVNINAGTIDAGNSYQVKTFGTMATVCGGAASTGKCPTGYSNQSASGTALNIGYEKQNFKADIGTTPLGFLTQNWIGGVKQKLDLGPVGVSLELARRPMTSTLLSYAGTRDPVTGSVWGGMVATGGTVGLSLDQGGTFGGWTYYRARSLTGTNVQSNSDNQFMAGLNYRIINETDRQLSSGLTGMLWGFKRNAGEFTYGQGGYYSPQSYRSVTLPLNYAQRFARFSYVLGGSVSTNWSRTDAAPYFPTNSGYQAAAASLGNTNTYTASSGPGSAYSLLGAWEYQVTPSVFVGNRLKLERSPYYAPNSFVLYVRIALDGTAPNPVPLQTQPVIPTSRF
ncbi:cellulose synthase subunit BcsC-related outer membrane protein [Polynucleobacter sp. JS-Polo-80-F4]|uniref:cellulose synthase subunit BcsC-related outer membrane protein n=1 Tax=Polynucleobacter sp. JS-Polo-80-F4 TaxID=2576918 RepID=UPI001C0E6BC1|nr:cellulose synthase subunit BcsC-related outer membrane protein [Polynucleobacter sp. JS-Polo-80-F4]MBU3615635.1 BCSC C-terminal domain-containing protein [Polynucleobacter sp. JS-Polo-80-F4]